MTCCLHVVILRRPFPARGSRHEILAREPGLKPGLEARVALIVLTREETLASPQRSLGC